MAEYTEMDWDAPIDDKPTRELIPAGDYDFVIDHFDRDRSKGGKKIPPSNMAVVYFNITAPDGAEIQIRENFILHQSMMWKISQLFISVGLMKEKEEGYIPEWSKLAGLTGRAKVTVDTDRDDPEKKYNHIGKLYPKERPKFSSEGF